MKTNLLGMALRQRNAELQHYKVGCEFLSPRAYQLDLNIAGLQASLGEYNAHLEMEEKISQPDDWTFRIPKP